MRNPSLNWAGLRPGAVDSISRCAPWFGEQVSVCSIYRQPLDKESYLVLILMCPLCQFPLALWHTGASAVLSVRLACLRVKGLPGKCPAQSLNSAWLLASYIFAKCRVRKLLDSLEWLLYTVFSCILVPLAV